MTLKPRPVATSSALVAGALLLTACSSTDDPAPADPTEAANPAAQEAGVSVEPGLASCEFNNELDEQQGDGSGTSPFGELERAELREEPEAYVVTFTGDFFDPDVLVTADSNLSLQIGLSAQDSTAPATALMTEYRAGELEGSGTFVEQEWHLQDTGAVIEDGEFTATFPKDSPHLEGFEPAMWFASVYFDNGDETNRPVSFRCGDGRSWDWEPAA